MAQGYARVSGKPGVLLVTSGPGATILVTPLMDASFKSQWDIVRLLLSRGAKLEIQNVNGYTALHAAVQGNCPGVLSVLCHAPGASAALALRSVAVLGSCTPLGMAIERGYFGCEDVLRAHRAPE